MKNGVRYLVKWSWLMVIFVFLLAIVCLIPGFQYLVFEMIMIGSSLSILWVGFLLQAVSE